MSKEGGCLCGAVRYAISGEPLFINRCYCTDCQKESGAGHLSLMAVPDEAVAYTGTMTRYAKPADGGGIVQRMFCPQCGSTLAGKPAVLPGVTMIRLGTLDDSDAVMPQNAIYVRSARPWDQPPDGIRCFEQMPPQRRKG